MLDGIKYAVYSLRDVGSCNIQHNLEDIWTTLKLVEEKLLALDYKAREQRWIEPAQVTQSVNLLAVH